MLVRIFSNKNSSIIKNKEIVRASHIIHITLVLC